MIPTTIEILKKLISFKTISGRHPDQFDAAFAYIDALIQRVEGWTYEEFSSGGYRSRLYAHKKHIDSKKRDFKAYLYGNIDVVDAPEELFTAVETDKHIIGRGAVDMKFGVAIALKTLLSLNSETLEKDLAFIVTTDEELGGINGAKYLVDEINLRGDVIIGPNGEVSDTHFNKEIGCKGTIHTKYIAQGIPAHGSRPWNGNNALDRLIQMYRELRERWHKGDAEHFKTTLSLGVMHGGFATNAVPDEAFMQVDFRYVTTQEAEEYYRFEKQLLEKHDVQKELIVDAINIEVEEDNRYLSRYAKILEEKVDSSLVRTNKSTASHDIREFFKVGMIPILCMPRGLGNHQNDEWVNKHDLDIFVEVNKTFLEDEL